MSVVITVHTIIWIQIWTCHLRFRFYGRQWTWPSFLIQHLKRHEGAVNVPQRFLPVIGFCTDAYLHTAKPETLPIS